MKKKHKATITITYDELGILWDFILTDAEDMRDMARAIEKEASNEEGDEYIDEENGDDFSLQGQAEAAQKLKFALKKRFEGL